MIKRFIISACICVSASLDVDAQIFKLPTPDSLAGGYFGSAVAIDGDLAVIGDSGSEPCGTNSGAAFVYERGSGNEWQFKATLLPKDCREGHFFGKSVAISGSRILVTSYRTFFKQTISNGVYVFEKADSTWKQTARITDPAAGANGPFASSVAIDGDRILVTSAGDASGESVNGAGYVFERSRQGVWELHSLLSGSKSTQNGIFGSASDLDGDRLAIAAASYSRDRAGTITLFELDSKTRRWEISEVISDVQDFFISLDLSGNKLLVGESKAGRNRSGRARIFTFNGKKWKHTATLRPSTPFSYGAFGSRVALSGNLALIVGFDEQLELNINVDRVVYVFELRDEHWRQRQILDVGDKAFGTDIFVSDGTAIVGQSSEESTGQVYIVRFNLP